MQIPPTTLLQQQHVTNENISHHENSPQTMIHDQYEFQNRIPIQYDNQFHTYNSFQEQYFLQQIRTMIQQQQSLPQYTINPHPMYYQPQMVSPGINNMGY